jgi:hypothetical protein
MGKVCLTILVLVSSFSLADYFLYAQPFSTPTLTGDVNNDFASSEQVDSGSGEVYAMTWDSTNLYLGVGGSQAYIKNEPTIWYIDTDPANPTDGGSGSTNGFDNYDGRIGSFQFTANAVIYMKAEYAELRTNNGNGWSGNTVLTNQIETGSFDIEITVPWSNLGGRPASMYFMMFKTNGNSGQTDAYAIMPGDHYISDVNSTAFSGWYTVSNTDDGQTMNVFGSNNAPLPVTLTTFTAARRGSANELRWSTATELNNEGFAVERSGDSRRWSEIGWVEGHGSTQEPQRYAFTDVSPLEGLNYYRLRQQDYDGRYEYSPVVTVRRREASGFSVYPNPAQRQLWVQFERSTVHGQLRLLNARGEEVRAWHAAAVDGALDLAGLRPGLYALQWNSERGELWGVKRIVLQYGK